MPTILAQIAPQRSTQYTELATDLAPFELMMSALGHGVSDLELIALGGQRYLRFDFDEPLVGAAVEETSMMAMTTAYFEYFDAIGEVDGPFMKPVEPAFEPLLPTDLLTARRYKGKTNEMFTHFMCNIARYSSDFSHFSWDRLRLVDPLAGGGTTLFVGLVLGADVAGVENSRKSVESTAAFLKQFAKEGRVPFKVREERIKQVGRRWWFDIAGKRCIMAAGETADIADLLHSTKPFHLLVTDLPYGVQHDGQLINLMEVALPAWDAMLLDGGVMVFSWDATRFARYEMIDLVHEMSDFEVLNEPPYDQLQHRVDRVIKQRDVMVARKG